MGQPKMSVKKFKTPGPRRNESFQTNMHKLDGIYLKHFKPAAGGAGNVGSYRHGGTSMLSEQKF